MDGFPVLIEKLVPRIPDTSSNLLRDSWMQMVVFRICFKFLLEQYACEAIWFEQLRTFFVQRFSFLTFGSCIRNGRNQLTISARLAHLMPHLRGFLNEPIICFAIFLKIRIQHCLIVRICDKRQRQNKGIRFWFLTIWQITHLESFGLLHSDVS